MNKDIKRIKEQADVVADVLQLVGTCVKAVGETLDRWPKNDQQDAIDNCADWKELDEKDPLGASQPCPEEPNNE